MIMFAFTSECDSGGEGNGGGRGGGGGGGHGGWDCIASAACTCKYLWIIYPACFVVAISNVVI